MSGLVFETEYRGHLWRVELSEFDGRRRLSIWSHYRDRQTGEWRPCGGRGTPGFIVQPDEIDELAATVSAIAEQLRSNVVVLAA